MSNTDRSGDRHADEVNHLRMLWEIMPAAGAAIAFGCVMYLQGRVVESGLPAKEWVQQATGADVYWAMAGFAIGLGAMGIWLAVEVYYDKN